MSGLAWLNELMTWLGRWFPRIVLVKAAHAAVWFGPGGKFRRCEPGLHWYWPITSEFTIVSMRSRTTEIASQLHGSEAVSIAVQYAIADPVTLLLRQNDVFSMLDDRAQACLALSYRADSPSEKIAAAVLADLRGEFAPHGVRIEAVSVLQRGWVLPLKNLNDWAQHAAANL